MRGSSMTIWHIGRVHGRRFRMPPGSHAIRFAPDPAPRAGANLVDYQSPCCRIVA